MYYKASKEPPFEGLGLCFYHKRPLPKSSRHLEGGCLVPGAPARLTDGKTKVISHLQKNGFLGTKNSKKLVFRYQKQKKLVFSYQKPGF